MLHSWEELDLGWGRAGEKKQVAGGPWALQGLRGARMGFRVLREWLEAIVARQQLRVFKAGEDKEEARGTLGSAAVWCKFEKINIWVNGTKWKAKCDDAGLKVSSRLPLLLSPSASNLCPVLISLLGSSQHPLTPAVYIIHFLYIMQIDRFVIA